MGLLDPNLAGNGSQSTLKMSNSPYGFMTASIIFYFQRARRRHIIDLQAKLYKWTGHGAEMLTTS